MKEAKVLYIAGNERAGKTPTCKNINKMLQAHEYQQKGDKEDLFSGDYAIHLVKNKKHVVICTASDSNTVIMKFIEFLKKIAVCIGDDCVLVLILAMRNEGDRKRDLFEEEIKKIVSIKEKLEFPLARVSDRADSTVRDWYRKSVDAIITHVLGGKPFNLVSVL